MELDGPRNIVIICLDTVRKDVYDEESTNLKDLVDISLGQCRAASSWSVPSHASILTGKLPHQHGVHRYNRTFESIELDDTFLRNFDAYDKIGVSANLWISQKFGFDKYFNKFRYINNDVMYSSGLGTAEFFREYDGDPGIPAYVAFAKEAWSHESSLKSFLNGTYYKMSELLSSSPLPNFSDSGASNVLSACMDEIKYGSEPFILFVNLMDAHAPYKFHSGLDRSIYSGPKDWSSSDLTFSNINVNAEIDEYIEHIQPYREIYHASIDYLDRMVSEFINDVLDETTNDTSFIITSDHGQNLGFPYEDSLIGHKSSLSESLLHVPLDLVNVPEDCIDVDNGYLSHLKLGELVTNLANGRKVDVSDKLIGAERIGSQGVDESSMSPDDYNYWNRMIRCLYNGGTKVQWSSTGNTTIYKLRKDRPSWQKKVDDRQKPPASSSDVFDIRISEYIDGIHTDSTSDMENIGEDSLEDLKDLGYL